MKKRSITPLLIHQLKMLWPFMIAMCMVGYITVLDVWGTSLEGLRYGMLNYPITNFTRYSDSFLTQGMSYRAWGALLGLCLVTCVMALYQQFFAFNKKRIAFMESLPYPRKTIYWTRVLSGTLVIAIPLLITAVAGAIYCPPIVKTIHSYARVTPVYQMIISQSIIHHIVIMVLKMFFIAMSVYMGTLLAAHLYGNIPAALGALSVASIFVFLVEEALRNLGYTFLDIYHIDRLYYWYPTLKAYVESLFTIVQNERVPALAISFVLTHAALIGLCSLFCKILYQRVDVEKLPQIFLFGISRALILIAAVGSFICLVFINLYSYSPSAGGMALDPLWWRSWLYAVIASVITWYLLYRFDLSKWHKRKAGAAMLALVALIGVGNPAKADQGAIQFDADKMIFLQENYENTVNLQEAIRRIGNQYAKDFGVNNNRNNSSHAFIALDDNDPRPYQHEFVFNCIEECESYSIYLEMDAESQGQQALCSAFRENGFTHMATAYETLLGDMKAAEMKMSQHDGIDFWNENLLQKTISIDGLSIQATYEVNVENNTVTDRIVQLKLSFEMPYTIKGAEQIEAFFQSKGGMRRKAAYHNGDYGLLQYEYLPHNNAITWHANAGTIRLTVKDGHVLHAYFNTSYISQDEVNDLFLKGHSLLDIFANMTDADKEAFHLALTEAATKRNVQGNAGAYRYAINSYIEKDQSGSFSFTIETDE